MPVIHRNDLDEAIANYRAAVVQRWDRYEDARQYLADHRPKIWAKVRSCGLHNFVTQAQPSDPDHIKFWAKRCDQIPWCLECVNHQHFRRRHRVFDRWAACTPAGQEPRFSHIVITAPIYAKRCPACDPGDTDDRPDPNCQSCLGRGNGTSAHSWGLEASGNPRAFKEVVWRTLLEMYGEGLGAHMTYQDHGEAGLARRHPHIDLTINGYTVNGGRVDVLPYFDFTEDRERVVRIVEKHAQALRLGARATSFYIGQVVEGYAPYAKILAYQVREMIDLRKLRYDRDQQLVGWESYREGHETTWMRSRDWSSAYEEYCARLRIHMGGNNSLHSDHGHMKGKAIASTRRVTGGRPEPHREGCPCSKCGDWHRIFLHTVDATELHALSAPYA
ncbi:MAG: hypothetical protein ABR562_03910 [Thermoplasmatota archaeon]